MLLTVTRNLILIVCFILTSMSFAVGQNTFGLEDSVADYPCNANTFFGVSSNTIRELQMNGSTITDMGLITTAPFSSILAVAYANDFMNGSSNRTFYSCVVIPPSIIKYDGVTWVTVSSDTLLYANAGGWGNYLYFQHVATFGQPNTQCISRLLPNGTMQKIFTDTSLVFTVADIETDSSGNVYFFRGPSIGNTTELTVIDSSGNIVNSYTADSTFNQLSILYGTFFMNGQLFIAHGIIPPVLRPVVINGSTVSLGTSILLPTVTSYKDMDNCFPSNFASGLTELNRKQQLNCSPNPFQQFTRVKIPSGSEVRSAQILSAQGTTSTMSTEITGDEIIVSSHHSAPGVYFLKIQFANGDIHYSRLALAGSE